MLKKLTKSSDREIRKMAEKEMQSTSAGGGIYLGCVSDCINDCGYEPDILDGWNLYQSTFKR